MKRIETKKELKYEWLDILRELYSIENLTDEGRILIENCKKEIKLLFNYAGVVDFMTLKRRTEELKERIEFIKRNYSTKKVVLKSLNPEEYPSISCTCKVIPYDMLGDYISKLRKKRIKVEKKSAVIARKGIVGEEVKTRLLTKIAGRDYITHEKTTIVGEKDMVVENRLSNSKETMVMPSDEFYDTYYLNSISVDFNNDNAYSVCRPFIEEEEAIEIDEDIVIIMEDGSEMICLDGSFIVIRDEEKGEYYPMSCSDFCKTYKKAEKPVKRLLPRSSFLDSLFNRKY